MSVRNLIAKDKALHSGLSKQSQEKCVVKNRDAVHEKTSQYRADKAADGTKESKIEQKGKKNVAGIDSVCSLSMPEVDSTVNNANTIEVKKSDQWRQNKQEVKEALISLDEEASKSAKSKPTTKAIDGNRSVFSNKSESVVIPNFQRDVEICETAIGYGE